MPFSPACTLALALQALLEVLEVTHANAKRADAALLMALRERMATTTAADADSAMNDVSPAQLSELEAQGSQDDAQLEAAERARTAERLDAARTIIERAAWWRAHKMARGEAARDEMVGAASARGGAGAGVADTGAPYKGVAEEAMEHQPTCA